MKLVPAALALLSTSTFIACAPVVEGEGPVSLPSVDQNVGEIVVRSRAVLEISAGNATSGASPEASLLTSASQPISVTNAPSVSFAVDNSAWSVPVISNALLDFGALAISDLKDNNLRVCGNSGNQPCGKAVIRVYTVGAAGAGVWNVRDNYGAPILAGLATTAMMNVGLDAAGAAVVQAVTIPPGKNVLRLSDFSSLPRYLVQADFTNAGAGDYSATLVIEYGLAP